MNDASGKTTITQDNHTKSDVEISVPAPASFKRPSCNLVLFSYFRDIIWVIIPTP